jgi:hypothetical protein
LWDAAAADPDGAWEPPFLALGQDVAARLQARRDAPVRSLLDWSVAVPTGCECALCLELGEFLVSATEKRKEWPLAKRERQHVHSRIDQAELPVTHVTLRSGRPYTLILAKTDDLFAREEEQRRRDQVNLEWLRLQGMA